jgi:hypothetical protein
MGGLFRNLQEIAKPAVECLVLILSGKPIPTIRFNVETIEYKDFNMNVWDVGGQN